jgi:hypothetical protein
MGVSTGWRHARSCCAVLTAVCLAAVTLRCVAANPADVSAENLPAQLEVLKRFAGDWQTETLLRRARPPAREVATKGKATCGATLGGRYYEFRAETIPAGDSDLQVMTYDEPASVYRQWVFSSDGYRHEATGVWDAKTSTLTWKGKSDGGEFVIEDRWASSDRLEWNLVRKDASGKVVQTITGTVSRAAR